MADSNDKGDGNHPPDWEKDGNRLAKTRERTRYETETLAREDDSKNKEKKFHLSRKTLIIGGVCVGVVLIGVFL